VSIYKKGTKETSNYGHSGLISGMIMQVLLTTNRNIPHDIVQNILSHSMNLMDNLIGDKLISAVNKDFNRKLNNKSKSSKINNDNAMDSYYKIVLSSLAEYEIYDFISYLGVVYSGFIYYPKIVFQELLNRNYFKSLIDWSRLILKLAYLPCYQVKIISLGMCAWLQCEEAIVTYPESLNTVTDLVIKYLSKQKVLEQKFIQEKIKNNKDSLVDVEVLKEEVENDDQGEEELNENELNTNTRGRINKDEDLNSNSDDGEGLNIKIKDFKLKNKNEDSDNIQSINAKDLKQEEINELCDRIESVVKDYDEYAVFSDTINNIKLSQLKELLLRYYESLSSEKREAFEKLLKIRRVGIIFGEKEIGKIPRRVLRIKKVIKVY
jgi:hypothetical protein